MIGPFGEARSGSLRRRALRGALASLSALLVAAGAWRHVDARPAAIERLASALEVAREERPTLVALFQPGDCAGYSGLIETWNELHREGALRVVGVGLRFSALARAALEDRSGPVPRFPIRFDLGPVAERAVLDAGHRRTPVALLLDGEGRARLTIPPVGDPRLGRALGDLVERYAELVRDD